MHTRPSQSPAPRRSSGRPLDVAASLVLTVGLLGCAAPVAQAAEAPAASAGSASTGVALPQGAPSPQPTSEPSPSPMPTPTSTTTSTPAPTPAPSTGAPTSGPTAAVPALTVTITGTFLTDPGELVKEGTRVEFSYDVENTGGVDLKEVLGRKTLAVGESFRLTTTEAVVSAQNLQDGFVPAESKPVRGTLPDGSRVTVSAPFEYRLPIPEKPPVAAEAPDLDVQVSGTFETEEGEPVVAGTKVRWVAEVTNTGDVALRDVQVADSEKLAELPVGETGVVSFESTVTERDVFNHSIFVASLATATTPSGVAYTENILGTLTIPAVTPVPIGPASEPTPTPTPGAATRPATEVSVPTAPAGAAASASNRTPAGHLASTGSDAAAVLPVAGFLGLLGAVGVLLGRRRRRAGSATE
ncbi:LPXTG cell wall anchor domain-containing protein [Rathayibacter sp. VKM Ac-2835]|uniref:DUF7507 domain-containing protein n=1 Tax=Rathayibacter sp. VKM Ac-2835 TaxID=2739043 RepID=UPI001563B309|nr:LPXTG cell wall anchor domain-containing protein [Rathayibacter sp. VKM Ac-2835]NRG42557.1 LPXTG cell wall anchor domain-containing protein [Rathayibacter sp. VKM Ac-2835]